MFLDIRFPTGISYNAVGGPGYSTDVIAMNSGIEQTNQNWDTARCSWDVSRAVATEQLRTDLIAFFRIAKGKANHFRFRDFTDYKVSATEGIVSVITAGVSYQLKKRYTNAAGTEDRTITLPVSAVIKQGVVTLRDGVDYSLNLTTGIVTVLGSPTSFPDSWSGQFDVPARFDTDMLKMVAEDLDVFRSQSIPIVEKKA